MAIRALKLDDRWDFVSDLDENRVVHEEGPLKGTTDVAASEQAGATVWELGVLDSRISGQLSDKATRFRGDPDHPEDVALEISPNDKAYRVVQRGLKGFRNFTDENANGVEYKTLAEATPTGSVNVVAHSVVERIPSAILRELSGEIERRNQVKDEELSKS